MPLYNSREEAAAMVNLYQLGWCRVHGKDWNSIDWQCDEKFRMEATRNKERVLQEARHNKAIWERIGGKKVQVARAGSPRAGKHWRKGRAPKTGKEDEQINL
jgi:hypothetical protein